MKNKKEYYNYKVLKDAYTMRLVTKDDVNKYAENFVSMDDEVAYYTGSTIQYKQEEVINFLIKCIEDESRFDFIVVDKDNNVIAESVLMDIDSEVKSAHYRIAIFKKEYLNQGIGSWAIKNMLDFAFKELNLHRVELEVFSYNTRARKAYQNMGFKEEGILRDSILDKGQYTDIVMMSILEDEWH